MSTQCDSDTDVVTAAQDDVVGGSRAAASAMSTTSAANEHVEQPAKGDEVGSIALGGRVEQDDYVDDVHDDSNHGDAVDDTDGQRFNGGGDDDNDDDGVGVDVRRREERGIIGGLVGGGSGGDYMKADNVYDDADDVKDDVDANVGVDGDDGYHVNVGDVGDVDDVRVCEAGRMIWEGGRMSVIKTDDDLKDSFSGEHNPYRKKVARVVVVISVVMLVMSILLVCVSLNMSKNIDDLVRSNNDLLRKSYEKDHFEDDNDFMNATLTNTTEP